MVQGYAAHQPGDKLKLFEYELSPLQEHQIEIAVEYCGICHSDLSMLDNEWGTTRYPFVPGHEIVGKIKKKGKKVQHLEIGQQVGVGWHSSSCMTCECCISGHQHLCSSVEETIVGRHGGFSEKIIIDAAWAIPIPENLDLPSLGPLFCGGTTVFSPLLEFNIRPSQCVGVVGIGGLGHMALRFLDAWGCEVTAFSTSPDKEAEAKELGADHFINSKDIGALEKIQGTLDFILVTVNVPLDWELYLSLLRPKGRLHLVGMVIEPLSISAFSLIEGQKNISGSPVGSPATMKQMLDFAVHHQITPLVEVFPLSHVNEALEKLRTGSPRYRIVLKV